MRCPAPLPPLLRSETAEAHRSPYDGRNSVRAVPGHPGRIGHPLGAYIKKVMNGEQTVLSGVLTPCEAWNYKILGVDREEQMSWKKYAASVLAFSRWSNDVASLRVFMATLRKKLEANQGSPQYIQKLYQ